MADQRGVKPTGMLLSQQIEMKGCPFTVDLVVLPVLEKDKGRAAILLCWAWLQQAQVVQARNTISFKQNGQRVLLDRYQE
jgi:hypothetical protein